MDEQMDVLVPPDFLPTGQVKTRSQAIKDGDWIGVFNLWIVSRTPVPSIIYQQRGPDRPWGANLLDVAAAGHYHAGEAKLDGMREAEEEIGKKYDPSKLLYLSRKMHVGEQTEMGQRKNILELYMVEDNEPLTTYKLDKTEVYAICSCPIADLLKVHRDDNYTFTVNAIRYDGRPFAIDVNKRSFPHNWDEYHFKIALLAERYFKGEQPLIY